jgi:hypothetical protein
MSTAYVATPSSCCCKRLVHVNERLPQEAQVEGRALPDQGIHVTEVCHLSDSKSICIQLDGFPCTLTAMTRIVLPRERRQGYGCAVADVRRRGVFCGLRYEYALHKG